jgi:hypothetical protein
MTRKIKRGNVGVLKNKKGLCVSCGAMLMNGGIAFIGF